MVPLDLEAQELYQELARGHEQAEEPPTRGNETQETLSSLVKNEEGQVVVYTDGGCADPARRILRRAGYGIYFGQDHE